MGSYLAILNPAAGGGRCGKEAPAALDRLRNAGIQFDLVKTQGQGDATTLARQAYEKGCRDFLALGGDGTSYEVINGLFPINGGDAELPRLGFLPLGTGNSFLRDFSDKGVSYALDSIIHDRRRKCDVIRVRHKGGVLHYINLFSLGFVADVTVFRNRHFGGLGQTGYVLGVLAKVAQLQPQTFPMDIDENAANDPVTFISINNSRYTGGKMMMAPDADPGDGKVDLITVKPMNRRSLVRAFPKIFKGSHVNLPQVKTTRVKKIDFHLDSEVDVMVDGEAIRIWPESLEVLPQAFEVRA